MKRAPISELKGKLSQFLDAVKAGEEVLVTERGRAVARITPVVGTDALRSRVEMLVRTGQLRLPREKEPLDLKSLQRPEDPEGKALEALLADRSEGR